VLQALIRDYCVARRQVAKTENAGVCIVSATFTIEMNI